MKIFLLAAFLAFVAVGSSINCYQCTNCKDDGKLKPKKCPGTNDTCEIISNKKSVNRTCALHDQCKSQCKTINEAKNETTCNCCQKDGCNGGVATTVSTTAIIVSAVMAIIYYFWWKSGKKSKMILDHHLLRSRHVNITICHSD